MTGAASSEAGRLVLMAVFSAVGIILGVATKLDASSPRDLSYVLRRTAKYGGWVMGALGSMTTIVGILELSGALKW